MVRVYTGNVECPPELAAALSSCGYEVVGEKPPEDPSPHDLALVPARVGITSTLRHALNNPLTAVMGFSQLLARRDDLPEDVVAKAAKIEAHARRIRALIREQENLDG